ncbi:MAG: gliding motility-associated C-terminal domain-containing protein, partial [Bacteroidota bacterium]
ASICPGDSVLLPGGSYTYSAGTFYDTLLTVNSCDSAIATTVSVDSVYSISTADETICDGDSALIFGVYRSTGGTYYDSLTTMNGCDSIIITILTVNPTPTSAITDFTNVLCYGDSTGSVTVTPSGGITPYTYLWNDPDSQTDSIATGLSAGIHTITVTDSNGCILADSFNISEPALLTAITGSTDASANSICDGTATVSASGGTPPYSYLWDDPGSQTTAIATGLCAGTYIITVTDSSGCSITDTTLVNEPLPAGCVENTNDSGPGSLRQAMLDANATPGLDIICFNIPGTGPFTIQPITQLPLLDDTVIINGYTQPGSAVAFGSTPAVHMIEIDGSLAGNSAGFFIVTGADSSSIQGLTVNNFNGMATIIIAANDVKISGNNIGTDTLGMTRKPNNTGILISNVANCIIGGTSPAERNIVSGNDTSGIAIWGVNATGNSIIGNYIGTNAYGTDSISNFYGAGIAGGASSNNIGGSLPGEGNLAAGNIVSNLSITGSGTNNNNIKGNLVGTDYNGMNAIGNTAYGIVIMDSASSNTIGGVIGSEGNLVSGNYITGIAINGAQTTDNSILGNLIGTDINGTDSIPNLVGLSLSGSTKGNFIGNGTPNNHNIISGNTSDGIRIFDSGTDSNFVRGNYIGTDITGISSISNKERGILIYMGASENIIGGLNIGNGNLISGNAIIGVAIASPGTRKNLVRGNLIGPALNGTDSIGNPLGIIINTGAKGNFIGGNLAGSRNIISANTVGVLIASNGTDSNIVSGNYIGTDQTGSLALSNEYGIIIEDSASFNMIGGGLILEKNIISANLNEGIIIMGQETANNRVLGNYIGTDATGTAPLGNMYSGVHITDGASFNKIGGPGPGGGNLIAYNVNNGIILDSVNSVHNLIVRNSIHDNAGLGIDIGQDGVTANDNMDTDMGANEKQNYPVISNAYSCNPGWVTVAGSLNSKPNTPFRLEFFTNTAPDPSGFGEGEYHIGVSLVTTDGTGNANFTANFLYTVTNDTFITATATDTLGQNTSEFSLAYVIKSGPGAPVVSNDTSYCFGDSIADMYATPDPGGSITWYSDTSLTTVIDTGNTLTPIPLDAVYYVTQTINGCKSKYDSVIISISTEIMTTPAGNNASCFGVCDGDATVSVSGGTAPYTYLWDDPNTQTTLTATSLCAGIYNVTVSDLKGCSTTDNIILYEPNAISINIDTIIDAGCIGACEGEIAISATGGMQPYTYLISNGTFTYSTPAADSLCADVYYMVVTDANGCSVSDTAIISESPNEDPTFFYLDSVFCQNDSNPVPTVTGYTPGTFSAPASVAIDAVSGQIDLMASIDSTYTITYTTGGPCPNSSTFDITILTAPNAIIFPAGPYCGLDSIDILLASPAGGTWAGPGIIDPINGTFNPDSAGQGSHSITYTVTDPSGCSYTDYETITVLPIPSVSISGNKTICEGDSTTFALSFNGIGPFNIDYTDGTDTYTETGLLPGDSVTFAPADTTTYTLVSITDSSGCPGNVGGSVTINVISTPPPPFIASPTIYYCEGDSIADLEVLPQAGGIIYWYSDLLLTNLLGTGNVYTPYTLPGSNIYYVTEIIGACESAASSIEVFVYSQSIVSAGGNATICLGDSVQLFASGGISYQWFPPEGLSDPNMPDPLADPRVTTTYHVIVKTLDSCFYEDSVVITVDNSPSCGLHIYNIFSPNGDDMNDTWIIDGIHHYGTNRIIIFNRWENIVIEFNNYDNKDVVWDGKDKNGTDLPSGTYFYIIKLDDETMSGWVEITR